MVSKEMLLQQLPIFSNNSVTVAKNQTVSDIVKEVLASHEIFAQDYDLIANYFDRGDNVSTAKALFAFLKANVKYKVEGEERQTTKSPSAILVTGRGDCKHYAGFIAGVLDALKRSGVPIDFNYRFASYDAFDKTPGHVFVVLHENGKDYWIDPVLSGFNQRLEPTYYVDKEPKNNIMLQRLSGITVDPLELDDADRALGPELLDSIAILLNYGIMDQEGRVNDETVEALAKSLPPDQFEKIANARLAVQTAVVGGFFEDLWRGVKKVSLAPMRNAYLGLVALNVFGYATKLKAAIYADGTMTAYSQPGQDKVYTKWRSLGGDWNNLENAIKSGSKKPAVLGSTQTIGVAQAVVPVWIATAGAIIAVITPLVREILNSKAVANGGNTGIETNMYPFGVCPDGITPRNADGSCANGGTGGGSNFNVMQFIQDNPLLAAGAAIAIFYLVKPKTSKS